MTTQETKIKKASLKDDVLEIEYEQIIDDPEQGPVINTFKLKGGNKPHQDLKDAFNNLRFHAAMICEQLPAKAKEDDAALSNYSITGLSPVKGNPNQRPGANGHAAALAALAKTYEPKGVAEIEMNQLNERAKREEKVDKRLKQLANQLKELSSGKKPVSKTAKK